MKLWGVVERVRSNAGGEAVFRAARRIVHQVRKIRNPALLPTEQLSSVRYRGSTVVMKHRRSPADLAVIQQCFAEDQYDMPTGAQGKFLDQVYNDILKTGRKPLIIDCGANIGTSVRRFLCRYPGAHVVAVEPAPDNFEYLKHNTAGLDVDLRLAGIAAEDSVANLSHLDSGGWGYRTTDIGTGTSVKMIGLRTLLQSKPSSEYTPFLLKIDIEGAENHLFDGNWEDFNRFPMIVMETHDWMLPGEGTSLGFFRFHAATGREFCVKGENVGSILPPRPAGQATTPDSQTPPRAVLQGAGEVPKAL